ncbi:MAG: HEPN domain-containing protein, partial [Thermoanaerobaculum sp.]
MTNRWKDWYEQGKRDRDRALLDIQYGYSKWACFALQQSAEKVVKAMGLGAGHDHVGAFRHRDAQANRAANGGS